MTPSRPSRRLLAVIFGALVSILFLAPSVWYLKDENPACQTQLHQEHRSNNSLSLHQDQRGGYRLQYQGGTPAEHCKWGHTAEEWIAGLTGALVAFTAGLATFTALLWWTTYDLWRSAEDGERVRERAYIRVSLTGNNVLASMNSAEMRAIARATQIPQSDDFGFSDDGGALRRELLLSTPWNPPHITFRVTNHGKTPADLLSGRATFSFIASHDPDKSATRRSKLLPSTGLA